jgi:hypothetical protein
VVEGVLVAALLVGGLRPPFCEELAERVPDDDEVAASADGLDDRVGVLRPAGGVVLAGEIDGDGLVAVLAQLGRDQVPVPCGPAASVDERECRH